MATKAGPTEELERLAALREKGALTEEEFQTQKQTLLKAKRRKRFYKRWWFRLPVGLAGLVLLISILTNVGSPKPLPTCESGDAEKLVKDAIENGAGKNLINLRLLSLSSQRELSYDDGALQRLCEATALLNTGQELITYRLFKTSKDDRRYFVEVNPR